MVAKIIDSLITDDLEQVRWLQKAQNKAGKYSKQEVLELVKQSISLRQAKRETQASKSPEAISPGSTSMPTVSKKLDVNRELFSEVIVGGEDSDSDRNTQEVKVKNQKGVEDDGEDWREEKEPQRADFDVCQQRSPEQVKRKQEEIQQQYEQSRRMAALRREKVKQIRMSLDKNIATFIGDKSSRHA